MRHSEGTFLDSRGTKLYYQAWHPGNQLRAVIVGIHGHGDHSGGLGNMIQYFVPQGYAWYGLDLRGHGRSSGLRGHVQSWADFRDDLGAFISLVRDHEGEVPIFLLGHSLGGLISLEYSMRYPEDLSGIIAICPPLSYIRYSPIMAKALKVLSLINPDFSTEQEPDYTKLTRDAEVAESLAEDPLRHDLMTAGLWREILKAQNWVKKHPYEFHIPLLMLQGLDDKITPAEGTRRFFYSLSLANKEYQEYEQTNHRPFDDVNRAEVLGHLLTWLDEQTEERKVQSI
ncbi:alpha/beta hydrolase [Desulfitobacterium sp. Sab5]|uniref:alpha/beta hydrolase n=1 Tax=Desulfitobacterium nosdiversum TaxID=3375356 RepID=UPI003CEAFEBD